MKAKTFEPEPWRCPACHQPLGVKALNGLGGYVLLVFSPGTTFVQVEVTAGVVHCPCGGSREWLPEKPKTPARVPGAFRDVNKLDITKE